MRQIFSIIIDDSLKHHYLKELVEIITFNAYRHQDFEILLERFDVLLVSWLKVLISKDSQELCELFHVLFCFKQALNHLEHFILILFVNKLPKYLPTLHIEKIA